MFDLNFFIIQGLCLHDHIRVWCPLHCQQSVEVAQQLLCYVTATNQITEHDRQRWIDCFIFTNICFLCTFFILAVHSLAIGTL